MSDSKIERPKLGWDKIGDVMTYTQLWPFGILTTVPHPLIDADLYNQGVEHFKKFTLLDESKRSISGINTNNNQ